MQVSVIIPTYNSASFISSSIECLDSFLSEHFSSYEIIIVDDGSVDDSRKVISALDNPNVRALFGEVNRGKGFCVKAGMAAASGEMQLFTDADLPYDMRAILVAWELINARGYHLVAGDRTLPGSTYYQNLSFPRKLSTLFFRNFVRLLVTGEQFDTQCGFKAFRKNIAEEIFPMLTIDRFAFDAEVLYVALKYNLEVRRIPVRYQKSNQSSVSVVRDGVSMLMQILAIPFKARSGAYNNEYLSELHLMKYWD